ncbi:MAG: cobalt-precorrin-6A reductase [Thermoleophilaceae bacterium]
MSRVLILGGTGEAHELAGALRAAGVTVTSSLAGRVAEPWLPAGDVRIGGFGGPAGLARWVTDNHVHAVVDATHPFAEKISAAATQACAQTGVALTRLERPGWVERPGDRWRRVKDLRAAATAIDRPGLRVLLTTGRLDVAAFAGVREAWLLIRCITAPTPPLPAHSEIVLARGPYTLAGELALIDRHRIGIVVTKDSGGGRTAAKLDAARQRGLPVVVVGRPPRQNVPTVHTVAEALDRLETPT